ncbi:mevalonate kinase [Myxozyma melibiosi]|uniref:Mevalonate kinase n=1 Tax=Myxozyma melibiosi TaxID=54550 RepID=A0ABR1F3T8_9ASCO
MVAPPFLVSAPGKTIIFGEHAAVYGKPAIAAALSLRTYMLVSNHDLPQDVISLEFPDVNLQYSWPLSTLPWSSVPSLSSPQSPPTELDDALVKALDAPLTGVTGFPQRSAALAFLYIYMCLMNDKRSALQGVTFSVRSTLPIGAGLGSSASVSVCISAAICLLSGAAPAPPLTAATATAAADAANLAAIDTIDGWAFLGERCIHGNPSGIDNAVATRGGAVMFQRMSKGSPNVLKSMRSFPSLRLLLIDSKQPRRTAVQVANVASLVEEYPLITEPIMNGIHSLTDEAYRLLLLPAAECDAAWAAKLRGLVRINHGLLVALGVSHPKLELIRAAADELKIGETKLTGAGGGGCAITLVQDGVTESTVSELRSRLSQYGFDVYETRLGGTGVGCLFPTKVDKAEWEEWEEKLFSLHHLLALEGREHIEETVGVEAVDAWAFW